MSKSRTKTVYQEGVVDEDEALALYLSLKDSIPWREGVRSRHGFTRLAYGILPEALDTEHPEVLHAIVQAVVKMGLVGSEGQIAIGDVYLNYYRDGNDYTPSHSHPHSKQLVISLGAPRKLVVGKKEICMKSGSAVVFGSATHGVPKDTGVTSGRISIAVFIPNL